MRLLCILVFCLLFGISFSQEKRHTSSFDVNYFKGNIALHSKDVLHLITGHPEGILLSYNRKTFGYNEWEKRFNYPDYGVSFAYQNFKNDVLGNNYSLYGHYNFYFLKRNLMFRIGQGLALTTNPYNRETNYRNNAFGSKILSATCIMLNYKKDHLFDRFGLQAGFSLLHYSNANVKAPNTSINSVTLNLGVTYNLDEEDPVYIVLDSSEIHKKIKEPIKYNIVFRSGFNESDVVGSGQFPFYIVSAYMDKRINRKSAFQFGADVFFSNFLKEYIYYRSVSFVEDPTSGDEDYKRVGLFVGHELFINRMSLVTQLGYYVYYPFDFEGRIYNRIGLKYYFRKKWFGVVSLKAHAAKAETVELGFGVRL